MRCGFFDAQAREYVITDPHTPVKWINYIGTRAFGGFVDHTGGALICKDDPALNRITRYILQTPSSDFKGETLYLRLHEAGGYRILSPFYVPGLEELDKYECHVGLGYSRLFSEINGVHTDAIIFVPLDAKVELRKITITNISDVPLTLDIIPLVEFSHPDALKQFTNADWVPQTMQARAVKDGDFTILTEYPFMARDFAQNYFASNMPVSSFETNRRQFLGANEYGSFRLPLSLLQPQLGCHEAQRGDTIAALLHPLGILQPGESRCLITQLGQSTRLAEDLGDIQHFRQVQVIDDALDELAGFWEEYLSAQQVQTPDEDMDQMLNIYNARQCYVTKTWSRYLSYYQPGLGARGMGMRDSAQDCLGVMASVPQEACELIRTLLGFQLADGSCMHQFNPLSEVANAGDSREMEDRPHFYSDDHLWLVLAVAAYLKETGDFAFLEEVIPFYDPKKKAKSEEAVSVCEHIRRGLDFTRTHIGRHGLPLLGFADWNDTVNLPGGAESLFTANLYGTALREMVALMAFLDEPQQARKWQAAYDEMKARVEEHAWDGEWYLRYFDEGGVPVGSSTNTYGKIYLNGQTWPVISGFASSQRARQAMDAVHDKLNTTNGIKISWPGFNGYDARYGGVTTYPPGTKENGGIFVHPNPWAVIAEAMLGDGERAAQYYAQVNPATRNDRIEVYECEPYVYAQNMLSDEHPLFGLARNSWLSGSAAWNYLAATQYILGIRPDYAGLRVAPCIPAAWDGFKVQRRFRGMQLDITVHNPEHVCKGVARIQVDGALVAGNLVPMDLPSGSHEVEVWLGEN